MIATNMFFNTSSLTIFQKYVLITYLNNPDEFIALPSKH